MGPTEAEYHGEFVDFPAPAGHWPKPPQGLIPTLAGAAGNEKNFRADRPQRRRLDHHPGEADIEGSVALLKQIWSDAGREGTPRSWSWISVQTPKSWPAGKKSE